MGVELDRNGLHPSFERFDGYRSYATFVNEYVNPKGLTRHWDEAAYAPYLWAPNSASFASYEDLQSLQRRAQFIREKKGGGSPYWEQSKDYQDVRLAVLYEYLQ